MKYIYTTLLFFLIIGMNAQHLNLTFCAATDEVDPILDKNGNDQRHKGAMILDYILVKKFGGSTAPVIWRFSKESHDWGFDNGTYLDRCENNSNASNCSGCGTCIAPRAKGYDFGTIDCKFENTVRVRGKEGNLYLESTGQFNQVCYTTPNIGLENYRGTSLSLEVGWEGTQEDEFASKNIRIYYSFNNEGNELWNKIINSSSKVLGKQFAKLSKTEVVPQIDVDGVNDLDEVVQLTINPNPVREQAQLNFNSNQSLELNMHISDLLGQTVLSKNIEISTGESQLELNTQDWSKGNYIIRLSNNSGRSSTTKLIVQ